MRILTRYVLAELAKWFSVSLAVLTLVIIVYGVGLEAIKRSMPLAQVIWLIPYILPDALRMAVPGTLLLATTSIFSRMSGENEVVAVKAMGISPLVMLRPVLIVAALLSPVTVCLNDVAVSWGRNGAQRVVVESVEEIAYGLLRTQRMYSSHAFSINVREVKDRRLIRPHVWIRGHGDSPAITIMADEAQLRSDRANDVLKIILRNATVEVEDRVSIRFPNDIYEQTIPLQEASQAGELSRVPSRLPLRVIPAEIVKQKMVIRKLEEGLAARAAHEMIRGDFDALTSPEWTTRARQLQLAQGRLYRLKTESHRRWSAGFSCLCFAFVGAPMAIRLRNSDFWTAFFVCFLPILVVYYPLLIWGVDGAKNGSLPPFSVWTGNLLLIAWGGYLLRKVVRY